MIESLRLSIFLGILAAWAMVLLANRSARGTTLKSAWAWSLLAMTVWGTTWMVDQCLSAVSKEFADHAWYAVAVLALCPPIAVLGSRRPGTRVWTWFIVFPMLLALGWPVLTLWLQGTELRGLQLETPQLVAFCLVLLMGTGNYCGTRYTLSALLFGVSILGLVVCSSAASPTWLADRNQTRVWCSVLIVLAVIQAKWATRPVPATRFDRLWVDFFDTFGIVWGRRIQDRVNFMARKESLPVRLELEGFVRHSGSQPEAAENHVDPTGNQASSVDARLEHILRWLLRRFVDPAWIDNRLGSHSEQKLSELSVDS